MNCKICGFESAHFGNSIILNKYDVEYFECSNCGLIQTEEPYWLDEAYNSAIASADVGILKRNLELAEVTKSLINIFFDSKSAFLDYGAGYGLFVRLMRDKGFNFFWYDKFANNLLSRGFESEKNKVYPLITAFEVFEHLIDPISEIKEMLKRGNSIFFSTTLLPKSKPKPGEWWYYSTFAGQHVTVYTKKSLVYLADKFDLNLISNDKNLHLLTTKKISDTAFKLLVNKEISPFINFFTRKKSLIDLDFETITGELKKKVK